MGNRRKQAAYTNVLIYGLLVFFSILYLIPFVWMVLTAIKPESEVMKYPPIIIPSEWQIQNFIKVLHYRAFNFFLYFKNTCIVAILSVMGTLISCSLAAYGFSRIRWRGRDTLFFITLSTMMIPFPVLMIPLYSVFRTLGWIGTLRPLWVPSFFGVAFNIFLLRQFFITIPHELSEAAEIDGCSQFRIYSTIIVPLAKPALIVVALFTFMYVWNDFLGPLIYLTKQSTFTLALGLRFFQSQHGGTDWNLLMAASTLVILPVIILFFIGQKYFIQGIALTGLKG
jgi:multiple sugar transport system permease protein